MAHSKQALNISVNEILVDVARQAIPFIIMDSTINIYYIVDQYTFNPMMKAFYLVSEDQLDRFYALFAGNANKLIMIIVSLCSGHGNYGCSFAGWRKNARGC